MRLIVLAQVLELANAFRANTMAILKMIITFLLFLFLPYFPSLILRLPLRNRTFHFVESF